NNIQQPTTNNIQQPTTLPNNIHSTHHHNALHSKPHPRGPPHHLRPRLSPCPERRRYGRHHRTPQQLRRLHIRPRDRQRRQRPIQVGLPAAPRRLHRQTEQVLAHLRPSHHWYRSHLPILRDGGCLRYVRLDRTGRHYGSNEGLVELVEGWRNDAGSGRDAGG
ncbi:uncharacterized protein MYCGRDRAFT_106176, partial [Zymoseptoria tritici IPO323]